MVSAIGHEPDSPLLDLVADVRASTPTDAAKRIVPDMGEELARIRQLRERAYRGLRHKVDREQAGLDMVRHRPVLANPYHELVERRFGELADLTRRARRCLAHRLDAEQVAAVDPSAQPVSRYDGLGMVLATATDDDRVTTAEQALPFAARVPQVQVRSCTGGHVSADCFDVDALLGLLPG